MVGEPVEQGGSEREVAGDLHPAREAETRSDAEAMALVHLDTELEQERPRARGENGRIRESSMSQGSP